MKTKITEVQIIPVQPKAGLIGFASVVIDTKFYINSIAIYRKLDGNGYRLTYPTKKVGERDLQIFHPINRELSDAIENAIFTELKVVISDVYRRI